MIGTHGDFQRRADALRGHFERRKRRIHEMQVERAGHSARFRAARDSFRWTHAFFHSAKARELHRGIDMCMRDLNLIKAQVDWLQAKADAQAAARMETREAAE